MNKTYYKKEIEHYKERIVEILEQNKLPPGVYFDMKDYIQKIMDNCYLMGIVAAQELEKEEDDSPT